MMTDAFWAEWQEVNVGRYTSPEYRDLYMARDREAHGVYDPKVLDGLAETELYLDRR